MRFRAGKGPPLVLLHGLGGSWRVWEPLLPALGERFDVLALTLPGHLEAPPFVRGGDLANEVEALLDGEGIRTAHLVGNSLGGSIALELAGRGRGRSVVAISPIGLLEEGELRALRKRLRASYGLATRIRPLARRLARFRRGRRLLFADVVHDAGVLSPSDAVQWFEAFTGCSGFQEIVNLQPPVPRPFDGPVCIAWPTRDRMTPEDPFAGRFARAIPAAARERIPNAGHVPMPNASRRVLEIIFEHARER